MSKLPPNHTVTQDDIVMSKAGIHTKQTVLASTSISLQRGYRYLEYKKKRVLLYLVVLGHVTFVGRFYSERGIPRMRGYGVSVVLEEDFPTFCSLPCHWLPQTA